MRLARPALAAAIVGLVIAVAWHLRPAPPRTGNPDRVFDGAPTQPDAAENPAARPRDVAAAPLDAASPVPDPAPAPTANAPTPAAAPLPGETPVTPMAQLMEGRHHVPPERVARVAEHEREFAAEPVDGSWARGAEADLLGKLAQIPGLALTELHVECRSTMCRVQVAVPMTPGAALAHNPLGEPPDFTNTLGLKIRWMFTIGDQSRTLQTVAYLWREGMARDKP